MLGGQVTGHSPEVQAIMRRLEKLETENKRFRIAGVVLLLFALIFLVGATQTGRRTVAANEFVLQDDQGHTRAKLVADSNVPSRRVALVFFDEAGHEQMSLASSTDNLGNGHANLALGEGAVKARFVLASTSPDEWAALSDGGLFLAGPEKARLVLSTSSLDGPSLEVADSQGYSSEVGAGTVEYSTMGQTQKFSAASIRLMGKDRKVIWSAP
jgi:hypothetical protein